MLIQHIINWKFKASIQNSAERELLEYDQPREQNTLQPKLVKMMYAGDRDTEWYVRCIRHQNKRHWPLH